MPADSPANTSSTRYAVGCMTGTSMDAIDTALIKCSGVGLAIQVTPVSFASAPLGALSARLRAIAETQPTTAQEFADTALALGERHASLIEDLLSAHNTPPDLCVLPGQTLYHAPPLSLQLINPWPVAHRIRSRVLHDLRSADLCAGGQGAPISPLADWVLFRDEHEERLIVNLGGFCNATHLPAGARPDDIAGFDMCACNHLLDGAARVALDRVYDRDGLAAKRGAIHQNEADTLISILTEQATSGRSLGSGDEGMSWVTRTSKALSPDDMLATTTHAVGTAIGRALRERNRNARVVLGGGGALNQTLTKAIASSSGRPCRTTESLGIEVQQREAIAMGVLGVLAMDGVGLSLKHVTRRTGRVFSEGSWIIPPT